MTDRQIVLEPGEWHASIVDVERETASKCIGTSFTARNIGLASDRYVGQVIIIGLPGAHWDLVGDIEQFEPPHTLRGRIIAIQPRHDEWGEAAE